MLQKADRVPNYYDFNEETGKLTFKNKASNLVDDNIVIVVSATDGVADESRILDFNYPF